MSYVVSLYSVETRHHLVSEKANFVYSRWNNGTRCRHGINVWQFAFACMGNLSPQMFILSCKRREGGGGIGEVHMVV